MMLFEEVEFKIQVGRVLEFETRNNFKLENSKMIEHRKIDDKTLFHLIRKREILFGGNARLKIYGRLDCTSGKRMKKENRIFFQNETEAINSGYRPCGHCMAREFQQWKRQEATKYQFRK